MRLIAFLSGLLFGVGLIVSGMTHPDNIIRFLDIFGRWNPKLAMVMMGAIAVHAPLHRWITKRGHPLFDAKFHLPKKGAPVDFRVIAGSAIFGVGWALAGYCPGPAIVASALSRHVQGALVFTLSMVVGMKLVQGFIRLVSSRTGGTEGK